MIRTQIYLTAEEKKGIASAALAQGVSQSDLIRRAIDGFLARIGPADRSAIIDGIAGIWKDRDDLPDIRTLRRAWRRRPGRGPDHKTRR